MKFSNVPVLYRSQESIWYSLFYEFYTALTVVLDLFPGRTGRALRGLILGTFFKSRGRNIQIARNVTILDPHYLSVGDNFGINGGCYISARGEISIGDNVMIGPYVLIVSREHNYHDRNKLIKQQGWKLAPIIIEDDVWISGHCTITSGVTLGKGCVIAAGSVVTKSVKPFTMVGGVPAKKILSRQ